MKAAKGWWQDEDVPDPLFRSDFRRRPDLLARAIGERHADDNLWGIVRTMPSPKPGGGVRHLACIDPVADLGYRQLVGRLVEQIEGSLPTTVFSSRCDLVGSTWRSVRWRAARSQFDRAISQEVDGRWCKGKGTLDVASHYPTVNLDRLQRVLASTGAAGSAVRDVIGALVSLQDRSPGLPIGPEGSAVLGTAALIPLDRRLHREGAKALRWMDDVVMLVGKRSEYESFKDAAAEQLAHGSQSLNLSKCRYEALSAPQDPTFAEIFMSAGGASAMPSVDPALELELRGEFQERGRIPTLLGELRKSRKPEGIDVLRRRPWIINSFPKQASVYLSAVLDAIDDWSWLMELVLADTTEENALAQLRVARLLPSSELAPDIVREVLNKALLIWRRTFAPLANQLFATSGRSGEPTNARRDRALEMAFEFAAVDAVRALLSPFLEGTAPRPHRAGLAQLARRHSELAALHDLVVAA